MIERLWWLGIAIAAGMVGICLFIVGYNRIRGVKTQNRWGREFWFTTAIILAFLSNLLYADTKKPTSNELNPKEEITISKTNKQQLILEETPEWKAIVEQWQIVSQLNRYQKNPAKLKLEDIKRETGKRLDALKQLIDKDLISTELLTIIKIDLDAQIAQYEETFRRMLCRTRIMLSPVPTSWTRLKTRLPALEKVCQSGKINYWTYKKIILRLKKDLEHLDSTGKVWYKTASGMKEEEIEALKEKARDLFKQLEEQIGVETKLSPENEPKVKKWITQLGDENWQAREEATKSLKILLQQTPAVIPFLHKALEDNDPEIRLRVRNILKSIEPELTAAEKSRIDIYDIEIIPAGPK